MLRIISFLVITFFITSCNQLGMNNFSSEEITASSKRVNEILDRHFDEALARNPEFSSNLGYKTGYDKWTERTDEFYDNERNEMRKTLDSLKLFAPESLDDQTKLSIRLFEEELKNSEEDSVWRHHGYWITQMGGEHNDIPSFLINIHQIQNDTDAIAYISRLKGVEKVLEQVTTQLKKRESIGVIPPAFTFPYVTDDLKNMIAGLDVDGEKNLLLNDFTSKLDKIDLPSDKKTELKQDAKEVLKTSVKKAYQDLLAYWQTLSEKQTENNGAWTLPQGKEYYKYCLHRTTTTKMTADEIYETGLKEVARIQAEMRAIMKKVNFKSDSLQEFFEYMRNDPKFKYSNDAKGKNDLLAESNSYIHTFKKVYLDKLFDNAPQAPLVVMEVEAFRAKSAGGAFYENPAEDGSRPGRFYVNTYNMNDEPRYQMEALCYHEAIPGHHMQIALAQELRDVPKFRKYSGNTAYIEGWALYSELLPKEVGLYQDPYSDFGRLSMEIFRAARLVVDVGIHSKKWTKEQAVDYFIQNTANAPGDIKHEIERYFLWPSQATGYKIGMIKILQLRDKAKQALGDKFDIKRFHSVILMNGSVPLDVLEELVDKWVEEVKSRK
jgi:uncharacterized protein (DUF885 family)